MYNYTGRKLVFIVTINLFLFGEVCYCFSSQLSCLVRLLGLTILYVFNIVYYVGKQHYVQYRIEPALGLKIKKNP